MPPAGEMRLKTEELASFLWQCRFLVHDHRCFILCFVVLRRFITGTFRFELEYEFQISCPSSPAFLGDYQRHPNWILKNVLELDLMLVVKSKVL